MEGEPGKQKRQQLKAALEDSQAAAKELVKDAANLSQQSAVLTQRAAQTRAKARHTQAQARAAKAVSETLLTIPEAAADLHMAERTLRHLLEEPALQARLMERTRKVGIYYKFIPLLPPDLMADLTLRIAVKKHHTD